MAEFWYLYCIGRSLDLCDLLSYDEDGVADVGEAAVADALPLPPPLHARRRDGLHLKARSNFDILPLTECRKNTSRNPYLKGSDHQEEMEEN